ncbi:lipopolysaccharide assembly protein LapA domain-containing protein [Alicyclobacillus sendaiensis]|uniref:lipopolysaccharide assembly protein LapA domain-containing protein n=1 Tax=Alicyclobacillus sendaiensis TaxID=192387 RepID=UPI000780EE92|nr:lipopolysaccharide assembly protein LapA domain-containing protein [Alicyclobacillus sendaiensis]
MRWKLLGAVVFAVLIVIFTLANSTDVSVNFVFTKACVNLVLVILLSVLLGMILMAILWSIHLALARRDPGARAEDGRARSEHRTPARTRAAPLPPFVRYARPFHRTSALAGSPRSTTQAPVAHVTPRRLPGSRHPTTISSIADLARRAGATHSAPSA